MNLKKLTDRMDLLARRYSIISLLLVASLLSGCEVIRSQDPGLSLETLENSCPITEPAWVKPPDDAAVSGTPEHGFYYVNEDRSILASAWWAGLEEEYLKASEDGIKMGWFRPAGAELEIIGKRIDGEAPSLDAHVPCCYPTRFQAAGLIFPTEGCWEITGKADDRLLTFVVSVSP